MDSATNMVPEIPIIISVEVICGLIWVYIYNYNVDAKKFAFNYTKITQNNEWWRFLSSTLSHIQILHLAFNLMSLWNTQIIEKIFGSIIYFQITFLLFFLSNIGMVFVYYIMSKYFNQKEYVQNMYAVGYSAVLFGFMSFECMLMNGNMNVFGFDIPFYLGPFVLLIIISVLVRNASFVGHLVGILSGFILGLKIVFDPKNPKTIDILFWLMFIQFIAIMIYSIYRSNLFGIATTTNETLLSSNSNNRKARIVNGVIVRGDSNV